MVLNINASSPYKVVISSSYNKLSAELKNITIGKKLLIITDEKVKDLYLNELCSFLDGFKVHNISLKSGDSSKNFDNYKRILDFLFENNFSREDTIIGFGGGMITDISGFVCSTYMRGIKLILLPTTLLSMIDSAIGGKNGINYKNAKNIIGTFYQPHLVYAATDTLKTLDKSEYLSGLGEAVKYAYIDGTFKKEIFDKDKVTELVSSCIKVKKQFVEEDEKDRDRRAILNFGHTVGHAIEGLSLFSISHGESVAIGIRYAINISKKYFKFSDNKERELLSLLDWFDFKKDSPFGNKELMAHIKHDKKFNEDKINLILIEDLGKLKKVALSMDELEGLL